MDNNHYNSNQSSDSFYSYNHTSQGGNQNPDGGAAKETAQQNSYQGNSTYQQNSYQGNGACQQGGYQGNSTYQQNSYQGNNAYQQSSYQGNSTYQQSSYQGNNSYQQPYNQPAGKKAKKKKERKPGGFGTKLAKCAALALVFGLVGGAAFEGVRLASGAIFEETAETSGNGSVLTQSDDNAKIESTKTSSSYVGTDVSDIVNAMMPSIVAITNVSETEYQSFWGGAPKKYENTSCGSGIIVSKDDKYLYIATNNHVVNGATSLTVTFNDNSTVSAEVKGTDPSMDLAVIKVELSSIEEDARGKVKIATLGNSDNLQVGEAAIAIGNALGYGQSVTTGCISALNREVSVSDANSNTSYIAELIQTDAAINPGNSGGALLNATGEVIGINSVKYSDTSVEGIGYAIPINTAMPIIEDLITKEKVDQSDSAYLGIAGVNVTSEVSSTYNMPTGVYVAQVTAGSAAEQAGIKKGDIITGFDGKEIGSMEELSMRLQYYKAGTTVDVTVQRASEGEYVEQSISVTLGRKM